MLNSEPPEPNKTPETPIAPEGGTPDGGESPKEPSTLGKPNGEGEGKKPDINEGHDGFAWS